MMVATRYLLLSKTRVGFGEISGRRTKEDGDEAEWSSCSRRNAAARNVRVAMSSQINEPQVNSASLSRGDNFRADPASTLLGGQDARFAQLTLHSFVPGELLRAELTAPRSLSRFALSRLTKISV